MTHTSAEVAAPAPERTEQVRHTDGTPQPETGHAADRPDVQQFDWRKYFTFNTDHKVIGIQYIVTTFIFFLLGGLMALLIRVELAAPGDTIVGAVVYNELFTMHGSIMIFLWVIPVLAGFGNYLVPLMIGADDMAFPRLNALAFWIIPPSGLLMLAGFLVGQADAGWTAYPPLSLQSPMGMNFWAIGVYMLGWSSIMAAINFMVTIANMRAPGMGLWQLPLFCWTIIATSIIVLLATPVLGGTLILIIFDRLIGTGFFRASDGLSGGDPILWQHLFWFYSHPAVYIMILPAMGLVSEILPTMARKPIFGYRALAMSSMAIAILGFTVWAHHMFTSGMNPALRIPFMITSMIIAVPTGIKVFSWLATVYGGKITLNTPMLFALGFVSMFVIGGLSGIFLASIPLDIHMHDTYFVVAHLHYVLFGGSMLAIFGGLYFWFPKMTGRMFDERLGQIHFWLTLIGFNLAFLPMHVVGLRGMPRRVADYAPEFANINLLITIGAFLLGLSVLPFLYNIIVSWLRGPRCGDNPWRCLTLEWATSSPPPLHNFLEQPRVTQGPYEYGATQQTGSVAPAPAGKGV